MSRLASIASQFRQLAGRGDPPPPPPVPSDSWSEEEINQWLTSRGITAEPGSTKEDLLELCELILGTGT